MSSNAVIDPIVGEAYETVIGRRCIYLSTNGLGRLLVHVVEEETTKYVDTIFTIETLSDEDLRSIVHFTREKSITSWVDYDRKRSALQQQLPNLSSLLTQQSFIETTIENELQLIEQGLDQ